MPDVPQGVACGALTGGVAVVFVAILLWSARRTRWERERFRSGRTPLPDAEFLILLDASGDYARFCTIVREGLSWDCGVPAELLRPEDTLRQLERLCFDGFYLHEIVFVLEEEFPGRAADLRALPPFKDWKTMTLRDLIERSAKELGFR
jgi:hypothetical protein